MLRITIHDSARSITFKLEGKLAGPWVSELRGGAENGSAAGTLADVEREAILRALEQSGGVLGGPRGAAARLGMKRTTLQSRMQKLGIQRR